MILSYEEIALRLLLTVMIGGAVGYERSYKNRPAGFRTHIIVCMGAAIVSMIQIYMLNDIIRVNAQFGDMNQIFISGDISRLGAQVISGIGFLGAGTIIKSKGAIRGLTTAASLWTIACIGLAIGMGYYFMGIFSAIMLVIVLVFLEYFEVHFMARPRDVKIMIYYNNRVKVVTQLEKLFYAKEVKVKSIEILESIEPNCETNHCVYVLQVPRRYTDAKVINDIAKIEEILKLQIINNGEYSES